MTILRGIKEKIATWMRTYIKAILIMQKFKSDRALFKC